MEISEQITERQIVLLPQEKIKLPMEHDNISFLSGLEVRVEEGEVHVYNRDKQLDLRVFDSIALEGIEIIDVEIVNVSEHEEAIIWVMVC